jgi:hypothetical protein
MNQSKTSGRGASPSKINSQTATWICDSCFDESRVMKSPQKEYHVAAGSFRVRRQRVDEPFLCPGHVGTTPWASILRGTRTVCTTKKPGHADHILSVERPATQCSVKDDEDCMPHWLRVASKAADRAREASVYIYALHAGPGYIWADNSSLDNKQYPSTNSADHTVVPQISSEPLSQAWVPPFLPKASYNATQSIQPHFSSHSSSQTIIDRHIAHRQPSSQALPSFKDFEGSIGSRNDE